MRHEAAVAGRGRSESTEDHLERIQELVDQKGYARVADTAASSGSHTSTVEKYDRSLGKNCGFKAFPMRPPNAKMHAAPANTIQRCAIAHWPSL